MKVFNYQPHLIRTTTSDPRFQTLVRELDNDLRVRNGEVMDLYDQHNLLDPLDTVIVALLNDEPVACGCFKIYDEDTVEVKRMYVRPEARGKGISAKILNELEAWARELGYTYTVLETGKRQNEALGLYRKAGYVQIPEYGPYVNLPDSVCFRKAL